LWLLIVGLKIMAMGNKKTESDSRGMKKSLGVASVFAICTGAAFSSGFFLLPGFAAEETGPSLPLAFLVAGILMLPAIFSISELGSAMPRSGGPYFFITRSFGPLTGIIGALGIYLQWLLKGAFAFVGVGYYLSIFVDVPIDPLAIALIVFFTAVNLIGVKSSSITEIVLVGILIIVLSLFAFAGIKETIPRMDEVTARFQPLIPFGITGFLSAIALVFVSFGGMGQVASVAGEIKNPSKTIPKGMLLSLAVVGFFYLVGTAIIIALVDQDILHDNPVPVAEAANQFTRFTIPVIVIVVAALAAFTSTGNAVILSAARYPLALSRDKLLFGKFSKLNKKGIPTIAVLATGVVLVLLVVAFDVEGIASLASGFLLFTFVGMCLSVIIFRESQKDDYKPGYKTPFYPWMQIIGIVVYVTLIAFSKIEVMFFIAGIIVFGFLWYYVGLKEKPSFSAAIYPLFARFARAGTQETSANDIDLTILQGNRVSSIIDRALFIDLDEKSSFDEAITQAANVITERLGGEREDIKEKLYKEAKHWLYPAEHNILLAPTLLEDIEQPEMIIIRGKIKIDDNSADGLIILLDDKESSGRLLHLTSQLESSIHKEEFHEAWSNAESAEDIKKAMIQDIRTITIRIGKSGKSKSMLGKNAGEVELPKGSIIALIQRKGNYLVPTADLNLEEGDEVTIVSEKKAFNELTSKYMGPTKSPE
jgi:basic amino acid/polyamine antiporter, APA family